MTANVVYEVTVSVQAAIAEKYRLWLDLHVGQILAISGFTQAKIFKHQPESAQERTWTIQYLLTSMDALNSYLENHAPAFRKEASDLFGTQFSAARRVMVLERTFDSAT